MADVQWPNPSVADLPIHELIIEPVGHDLAIQYLRSRGYGFIYNPCGNDCWHKPHSDHVMSDLEIHAMLHLTYHFYDKLCSRCQ
jgi:hypothetical protein